MGSIPSPLPPRPGPTPAQGPPVPPRPGGPPQPPPSGAPIGQPKAPAVCTGVPVLNMACAQLSAAVGPNPGTKPGQQPNVATDVMLIQKLINVIVKSGYVENSVLGGGNGKLATPLAENGSWSPALYNAIKQIELLYFHGRANPHGIGVIDPQADESMFTFLVGLANGSQKAKKTLSVQMIALAAAMVPGGRVLMDAGGKAPDGSTQPAKISRIDMYLPGLLDALTRLGVNDTDMVLVALACVRTETGDFVPKDEPEYDLNTTGTYTNNATGETTWTSTVENVHGKNYATLAAHHLLQTKKQHVETWNTNDQSEPGDIYQSNKQLGNTQPGDGWRYRGRGLIQLTGRSLYLTAGTNAGLGDLFVRDPDQVNSAENAGAAVAGYLKINQPRIEKYLRAGDLTKARISVNGGTNGIQEFKDSMAAGQRVIAQAIIEEARVQVRHKRRRRPKHK